MTPGEEQGRVDCVETDFKTVAKIRVGFEV